MLHYPTAPLALLLVGDLMDLLVNGVLKKGYLTKKGHVRKNWKRRFFVLKTDSLHYYRDREQTDKKVGRMNTVKTSSQCHMSPVWVLQPGLRVGFGANHKKQHCHVCVWCADCSCTLAPVIVIGSNLKESEVTHWQTIMSWHHPTALNSVMITLSFSTFTNWCGIYTCVYSTLLCPYTRTQAGAIGYIT